MSMSKRDFVKLADALRGFLETRVDEATRTELVRVLAQFCAQQNPNFNATLWVDYLDGKCGPSGGKP